MLHFAFDNFIIRKFAREYNINSVYSQFSGINFAMKLCSEILKNYILKLCRWNSMRSSIHYTLNMHTVFSCNKKKVIEFFALHENTFKMIPNHISFDKYWCCFTSFQAKKKIKIHRIKFLYMLVAVFFHKIFITIFWWWCLIFRCWFIVLYLI